MWFDISIQYKMITVVSLVINCHTHKVITILTIFPMLYITSPWFIFFYWKFVPLNLLLVHSSSYTLLSGKYFSLSTNLFIYVHLICVLDSTHYKWHKIVFVFPPPLFHWVSCTVGAIPFKPPVAFFTELKQII